MIPRTIGHFVLWSFTFIDIVTLLVSILNFFAVLRGDITLQLHQKNSRLDENFDGFAVISLGAYIYTTKIKYFQKYSKQKTNL